MKTIMVSRNKFMNHYLPGAPNSYYCPDLDTLDDRESTIIMKDFMRANDILSIWQRLLKHLPEQHYHFPDLMHVCKPAKANTNQFDIANSIDDIETFFYDFIRGISLEDKTIKAIDLSLLNISTVPEILFYEFKEINNLCLTFNQITELPEGLRHLSNIEILNVSYNCNLKHLAGWIGDFNQLKTLNLNGCGLAELPETIGRLSSLEEMALSGTPLKKLPEQIGRLNNLKCLFLESNRLTVLPASMGDLLNLEQLVLSDNALKVIPESIYNLPALKHLDVSNNPNLMTPERFDTMSGCPITTDHKVSLIQLEMPHSFKFFPDTEC